MTRRDFTLTSFAAVLAQGIAIAPESADVKEFVFLPAGEHEICATVDGKPERVTVKVDAAVAGRLHADLTQRLSANVQPFIDYDHARAKSAGRPKGFRWDPVKGVICQVEWTQAATVAIRDGEYAYFSPEFSYDRKNQTVKGLRATGPVGGLVNDPAFRAMPAVTAASVDHFPEPQDADAGPSQTPITNSMNEKKIVAALIAAGIISDTEAATDAAPQMVVARFGEQKKAGEEGVKASHATVIEQKDNRIKELEGELTTARNAVKDVKEKEAAAAVTAAVQAGRIAPKDQATQDWWKASILADTTGNSLKALNAVPVNPALKATTATTPEGADKKEDAAQCSSAEFEAMSHKDRMEFSKKGGRIKD